MKSAHSLRGNARHSAPPAGNADDDDLLNTKDAAHYVGKKSRTLQDWRRTGRYKDELPYYRIGKDCFYQRGDLRRFLESCKVGGEVA